MNTRDMWDEYERCVGGIQEMFGMNTRDVWDEYNIYVG
jgi:hypothetical protein